MDPILVERANAQGDLSEEDARMLMKQAVMIEVKGDSITLSAREWEALMTAQTVFLVFPAPPPTNKGFEVTLINYATYQFPPLKPFDPEDALVPGYEMYGLADDKNWSPLSSTHEIANTQLMCSPPKYFVRPKGGAKKTIRMVTSREMWDLTA